jgi:hypothetical protein
MEVRHSIDILPARRSRTQRPTAHQAVAVRVARDPIMTAAITQTRS